MATDQSIHVKGIVLDDPKLLLQTKVEFFGSWVEHKKYGRQFQFDSYEIVEGELHFFLTKMVKGISQSTAKAVIRQYGDSLHEIIEERPEELLTIKGIGKKKLEQIVQSWKELAHLRKLGNFLLPFGVTNNKINRIFEAFKEESLAILQHNPYRLTHIEGFGFRTADEVARKIGTPSHSPYRIETGIRYVMEKHFHEQFHTLISDDSLWEAACENLRIEEEFELERGSYRQAVEQLLERQEIVAIDTVHFTFPAIKAMEDKILKTFRTSHITQTHELSDSERERIITLLGFSPDESQYRAIALGLSDAPIFTISGYAGAGKTSIAKAVLRLLGERWTESDPIHCCALSGIAANRIKEATGYPSRTIHSLLGFDGKQWKYHQAEPLPYRLVVLDEASMVDITLWYRLLDAIDLQRTRLMVLGDPGQIPPVGMGDTYLSIIRHQLTPGIVLEKVHRQSEDSAIPLLAESVRQGLVPENYRQPYQDYRWWDFTIPNFWQIKQQLSPREVDATKEENRQRILEAVTNMVAQNHRRIRPPIEQHTAWEYLTTFQVITPMREYTLGTKEINRRIQTVLNPKHDRSPELENGDYAFRLYDKVVHTKNQDLATFGIEHVKQVIAESNKEWMKTLRDIEEPTEMRVMNGQLGLVIGIDSETEGESDSSGEAQLYVYYPNENYVARYESDMIGKKMLELAYALTIHKTQGAQFGHVYLVLANSHYIMLQNRLLYTAMTRARSHLMILGEDYAFKTACTKKEEVRRETLIELWCRQGVLELEG